MQGGYKPITRHLDAMVTITTNSLFLWCHYVYMHGWTGCHFNSKLKMYRISVSVPYTWPQSHGGALHHTLLANCWYISHVQQPIISNSMWKLNQCIYKFRSTKCIFDHSADSDPRRLDCNLLCWAEVGVYTAALSECDNSTDWKVYLLTCYKATIRWKLVSHPRPHEILHPHATHH